MSVVQMTLGDKVFTSNTLVMCLLLQNILKHFTICLHVLVHADKCMLEILYTGIASIVPEMQILSLLPIQMETDNSTFADVMLFFYLKEWMCYWIYDSLLQHRVNKKSFHLTTVQSIDNSAWTTKHYFAYNVPLAHLFGSKYLSKLGGDIWSHFQHWP